MFTGIIEAIGSVAKLQQLGSDWRLTIDSGKLDLSDVGLGDSIAVNGCCLTVVELQGKCFVQRRCIERVDALHGSWRIQGRHVV